MIAAALLVEIERFAAVFARKNPLFLKAADGTLTAAQVAQYVVNIRYHILQNVALIARARDVAAQLGDATLSAHFAHKLAEEVGHDRWADDDLEQLAANGSGDMSRDVVPAMVSLCAHLRTLVERDPALWLSHALFAEDLTVRFGPAWLRDLEENCGVPRSALSVFDKHIEADKHHVHEALDQIDDLVGDPAKLGPMRDALRTSMRLFLEFCNEVVDDAAISGRVGMVELAHAPAA